MSTNTLVRGHPLGWSRVLLRRAGMTGAALLTAFLGSSALRADNAPTQQASGYVEPSEMGTGSLLLKTVEPGHYLEAPRLKTDVAITVTGPIARARITQRFENPSDKWVEGVYVFPLPANSGVDTLRMQIGDRFLEGDVKEREQARQIYEHAAAQGYKATLIEQQRPNMFTNSVANIGPHETVVVQIEYQEPVKLDGDKFSLRVPLVVGPRYTPPAEALVADSSTTGPRVVAGPPMLRRQQQRGAHRGRRQRPAGRNHGVWRVYGAAERRLLGAALDQERRPVCLVWSSAGARAQHSPALGGAHHARHQDDRGPAASYAQACARLHLCRSEARSSGRRGPRGA